MASQPCLGSGIDARQAKYMPIIDQLLARAGRSSAGQSLYLAAKSRKLNCPFWHLACRSMMTASSRIVLVEFNTAAPGAAAGAALSAAGRTARNCRQTTKTVEFFFSIE